MVPQSRTCQVCSSDTKNFAVPPRSARPVVLLIWHNGIKPNKSNLSPFILVNRLLTISEKYVNKLF